MRGYPPQASKLLLRQAPTQAGVRARQFDKLYKHGYMSKHDAYQWLGGILSVPAKQAHIAQLSLLSCNLVIREAKKQVNWYHMRKMAALQQTQEGDVKAS